MRRTAGILLAVLALSPLGSRAAEVVPALDPVEIARDLESVSGSPAAAPGEGRRRLLAWMRVVGLERIEPTAGGGVATGILPGATGEVILVIAVGHPGDPSWPCDARKSAVALATLAELAAVPRRRAIRLLVLEGGETARAMADRWLDSLSLDGRERLLAVLDLHGTGGCGSWTTHNESAGIVRLAPIESAATTGLRTAPSWLVHAALAAGRAVGEPVAVAADRFTLAAQCLARSTFATEPAVGDAFLAAGIPAVSLGASSLWAPPARSPAEEPGLDALVVSRRLTAWKLRLTALARRLDVLDGRPRPDTEYLAWLGRVWSRRDLYWAGLVVWIALVVSGLPGSWRGRTSDERAALGRRYLPGFAARGLLLLAILALPVLGLFLLLPAAVVWIAISWFAVPGRFAVAMAVLPGSAWAAGSAWLVLTNRADSLAVGIPALALIVGTLGTVLWVLVRLGSEPASSE